MVKITYNNSHRRLAHLHASRMIQASNKLGLSFYSYKSGSFNNEETSYIGKLAEVIIAGWLKKNKIKVRHGPLIYKEYKNPSLNYGGDFEVYAKSIKKYLKVELKSKTCNSKPKSSYEFSVTRISKADIYLFVRINDLGGLLWICGWINNSNLRDLSQYRKAGSVVKNAKNAAGFVCNASEYVIGGRFLKNTSKFLEMVA